MLLNYVQATIDRKPHLKISRIGKSKKLEWLTFEIPRSEMFEWSLDPASGVKDTVKVNWKDGKNVFRKSTKYLNKFRLVELIETLPQSQKDMIYEYNEPYKSYCDIETEMLGRTIDQMMKDPVERILTVCVYDEETNFINVYGIKELGKKDYVPMEDRYKKYLENFPLIQNMKFKFNYYSNEFDMLYHLFSKVFSKQLVIMGWNFVKFDWTYLVKRANRLGIDAEICAEDNKLDVKTLLPKHKLVLDLMEMFNKWSKWGIDLQNSSLDEVSHKVLGVVKVKYAGTLQELYENDYGTYVFYNIVDTVLCKLIDDNKKTFMTMMMIAALGNIESIRAFSPVHFTETVFCRNFLAENKVLAVTNDFEVYDEKIDGGYVKDPDVGIHSLIAGVDFASLYPMIKMMLNVSPESFLGYKDKFTEDELKDKLISIIGTVFSEKESVTKRLLVEYYAKRKKAKNKMLERETEIDRLKKILNEKKANAVV
jgi:DNA polymerase elongation subunit (family B)